VQSCASAVSIMCVCDFVSVDYVVVCSRSLRELFLLGGLSRHHQDVVTAPSCSFMRKTNKNSNMCSEPLLSLPLHSSNDVGHLGACAVAVGITGLTSLQELYLGCVVGMGGPYVVHISVEACET
jgi:hypothetical protein